MGSDSLNLWGPVLGLGANTPPNLSNIHDLGAAKRFKCFFGPRAILLSGQCKEKERPHYDLTEVG